MVRYLVLFNFTEQGIKNIAQTLSRSEAFQKAAQEAGASVKAVYWLVGGFDGALVLEAADETTATALVAKLASAGNVRTQTLRAFDRGEMEGILGKVR
jgi:uncharacterized protein with GYD domain